MTIRNYDHMQRKGPSVFFTVKYRLITLSVIVWRYRRYSNTWDRNFGKTWSVFQNWTLL